MNKSRLGLRNGPANGASCHRPPSSAWTASTASGTARLRKVRRARTLVIAERGPDGRDAREAVARPRYLEALFLEDTDQQAADIRVVLDDDGSARRGGEPDSIKFSCATLATLEAVFTPATRVAGRRRGAGQDSGVSFCEFSP